MNPTNMKPKHIGRAMQALCKSLPSQSSSTMAIITVEDICAVLHTSNVVKHLLHTTPIVPILRGSSGLVSQVAKDMGMQPSHALHVSVLDRSARHVERRDWRGEHVVLHSAGYQPSSEVWLRRYAEAYIAVRFV